MTLTPSPTPLRYAATVPTVGLPDKQTMAEYRVMLAEDHLIVREGLRSLLQKQDSIEVVGEVANGTEVVQQVKKLKPDVVLMDVRMPVLNGVEATMQLARETPKVRVLAMSAFADKKTVNSVLEAGAAGYILKDSPVRELVAAVEAVGSGQGYLSPSVTSMVIESFLDRAGQTSVTAKGPLTRREREVMQLFAEGFASRQIASQLHVSVKTIDTHRYQIMKKLKLRGMADLTRYAIREGMTSVEASSARGTSQ